MVPVIVIVYVPALVERLVETVSVVVPVGLADVRVTLATGERVGGCLTAGRIVAERFTVPVNPFNDDTVIVKTAEDVLEKDRDAGLAVSWKSGERILMFLEARRVVWYGLS